MEVEISETLCQEEDQGENEVNQYSELTNLLPMQPMYENEREILEKEYYNHQTTALVEKPTEEEVIPTEFVSMSSSFSGSCETPGKSKMDEKKFNEKHTQEEIISKLLQDKISFSEVAKLLGDEDEDEDSDLEAAPSKVVLKESVEEDHAAQFEKELNEQQRYHLKRKGKEKRRRRRLPAALQGLMGEANLRYARREYEEAIKMCMEIIRQYPHSPEPYQTLGMIYEEKKLVNKSLQFLLIAAFLSPNAEDWEKLAELSLHQQGDIQQAVFCWGRAIKANPQNLDYHWARCDLLEQIGEKTKALKGYIHMVKFLRPDQGKDALKLAKEIAKIHYENGDISLALEAMETAFRKHPSFVTAEDTNLMLELLMQREQFVHCISILIQYMKVKLTCETISEAAFNELSIEEQVTNATTCHIPDDLPIDLCIKLAIGFIHLKKFGIEKPIVESLTRMAVSEYGDLYLEISEAYSKAENPSAALPLLETLLKSESFDVAAVWLLYGECLASCSRLEEAVEAYKKVVELVPQLGEPRLTLSGILQFLGRTNDALKVLNQEGISDIFDSAFLHQKCKILLEHKQIDDFITTALLLFKRQLVHIRSQEEAEALLSSKKLSNKFEALRDLRRAKNEPVEDESFSNAGQEIPIEDQWDLFKQLCEALYEKQRFVALQRLTFSALGSRELMRDKDRSREIEFFCLLACVYNESFYFAFNIIREIIVKCPGNARAWNILCYIISKADDFRHNRFLLRLTHKHPDLVPLAILNGHNCLVSGNYKFSIAEYTQALKSSSKNPLIPLMLGLTYTHMACQKFSGNKSSLVLTATAFLNKYLDLRTECQESLYNLGRAMQQLSLYPQAVHYYKKALQMPPPPFPSIENPDLNLVKEIAFNLALIYKKSGNPDLARMYISKYIRYD